MAEALRGASKSRRYVGYHGHSGPGLLHPQTIPDEVILPADICS
jgi:hypothetical protein